MVRRFFGAARAAVASAFDWCGNRDDDEIQNTERVSAEVLTRYRNTFNEKQRQIAEQPEGPLRLDLVADSFPRICVRSREQKKPILMLVQRNLTDQCFRDALTQLVQADAVIDLITEKFLFLGFSLE